MSQQSSPGSEAEQLEQQAAMIELEAEEVRHAAENLEQRAEGLEREAAHVQREAERLEHHHHHHHHHHPAPPPRPVKPPRVHGSGMTATTNLYNTPDYGSAFALPVREFYPQFQEVPAPADKKAGRALLGRIQPFDHDSDVLKIASDLWEDRLVDIQEGRLRHREDCTGTHAPDLNQPWLVNMEVEFEVLALEFPDSGRQPEAYAVRPEVSRQFFPAHPHLRDDLEVIWRGRRRQALCSFFAPDGRCNSLVDLLDFTALFLAKHLIWERTRRLVDQMIGRVLVVPTPGEPIIDLTGPVLGPAYSMAAAPLLQNFVSPMDRRFAWRGLWPGSAAPHDFASNLTLPDNSPCHCGSGRKYANCHKSLDAIGLGLFRGALAAALSNLR